MTEGERAVVRVMVRHDLLRGLMAGCTKLFPDQALSYQQAMNAWRATQDSVLNDAARVLLKRSGRDDAREMSQFVDLERTALQQWQVQQLGIAMQRAPLETDCARMAQNLSAPRGATSSDALEAGESFGQEDGAHIVVRRKDGSVRLSIKDERGVVQIDNEELVPINRIFKDDTWMAEMFGSGQAPKGTQCFNHKVWLSFCWVPVGTEIRKLGPNSETYKTKTGVFTCSASVAGRNPCEDLKPIRASRVHSQASAQK
jgi:hypothetical protein